MSLCMSAFTELQPTKYSQMKQIFEDYKVTYDSMCMMPLETLKNPELVVQIERNFYSWEKGAPMIMAYLVFK